MTDIILITCAIVFAVVGLILQWRIALLTDDIHWSAGGFPEHLRELITPEEAEKYVLMWVNPDQLCSECAQKLRDAQTIPKEQQSD